MLCPCFAFQCASIPPSQVHSQLGKLCAYLQPAADSRRCPSLHLSVVRVPTSGFGWGMIQVPYASRSCKCESTFFRCEFSCGQTRSYESGVLSRYESPSAMALPHQRKVNHWSVSRLTLLYVDCRRNHAQSFLPPATYQQLSERKVERNCLFTH